MNYQKERLLLLFITCTIIGTIAVQVYWNYKNYIVHKTRITNEIQICLDQGIDQYYADITKDMFLKNILPPTLIDSIQTPETIIATSPVKIEAFFEHHNFHDSTTIQPKVNIFSFNDSLQQNQIKNIFDKVMVSMSSDSLSLNKLHDYVDRELKNKSLDITFGLERRIDQNNSTQYGMDQFDTPPSLLNSRSAYISPVEGINLYYNNATQLILARSAMGILLSLILALAVISCLFYMLKVIKKQKQLAELKHDLISNITHEFKTPITTIQAAIEAIDRFNVLQQPEKTKRYLQMSSQQLNKLNHMVEKLLETATLDSDKLIVQKEQVILHELLNKVVMKHQPLLGNKTLNYSNTNQDIILEVDPFHFENVVSNLIDNAIKYGGETIHMEVYKKTDHLEIIVSDNGFPIAKQHQEQLFEKFYRIPTGNQHNIKGFGIGLYYAANIIAKHNGLLTFHRKFDKNHFQISIPV